MITLHGGEMFSCERDVCERDVWTRLEGATVGSSRGVRRWRGGVLVVCISGATLSILAPASGQIAAVGATIRASVATGGGQASGSTAAVPPSLSSDGRFLAFHSRATNLVSGDANGTDDVFVRDLRDGVTSRVSVSSSGAEASFKDTPPRNNSSLPDISADGRFVAFLSGAFNLVPNDTNGVPAAAASADLTGRDAFVRDRQAGTTTRVSVATGGAQGDCGVSTGPQPPAGQLIPCGGGVVSPEAPSISSDGTFVAFGSTATNLVTDCTPVPTPPARCDTNNQTDVFVNDRRGSGTTTRVSVTNGGAQATGGPSVEPSISADGKVIAFRSQATNLVTGDTNGMADIFVYDRRTATPTTTRVSVSTAGDQACAVPAPGCAPPTGTVIGSFTPRISDDGCYVAFSSSAVNLVAGDGNGTSDVFVRGPLAGCPGAAGPPTTIRVSMAAAEANGNSLLPDINVDGRFVSFESDANNLLSPGVDTNNQTDVFVYDRTTQVVTRVSVPNGGGQANGVALFSALNSDGRLVGFSSDAANLVAGDTNAQPDVFVNDRAATAAAPAAGMQGTDGGAASGTAAAGQSAAAAGASAPAAAGPNAAASTSGFSSSAQGRTANSSGRGSLAATGLTILLMAMGSALVVTGAVLSLGTRRRQRRNLPA